MPPGFLSPLDRLSFCENRECVNKIVDEYLSMLLNGDENFPLFKEDENLTDEKTITNSYIFTETLIEKLIESDIDFFIVLEDLRNRLGNRHPVLFFLKQLIDE